MELMIGRKREREILLFDIKMVAIAMVAAAQLAVTLLIMLHWSPQHHHVTAFQLFVLPSPRVSPPPTTSNHCHHHLNQHKHCRRLSLNAATTTLDDDIDDTNINNSVISTPQSKRTSNTYSASQITVLTGLEPVRKRPGMYIGSTGPDGLHHLVYEVLDNSVDEALAGHARWINMVLHDDDNINNDNDDDDGDEVIGNCCTISDDGRGKSFRYYYCTHLRYTISIINFFFCSLHLF